ncbi:MAG: hypothetical protein IJX17_04785, partial [Clostridia bacterium]|nr:hypothetical protein [Clostridia bacterium]
MYKTEKTSLSLKNYYFDIGTTIFLLVRVKAGQTLSIHSLGLNQNYVLNFLVQPDDAKVIAANDKSLNYVFYVLKVTFDRSLEKTNGVTTSAGNENPEYILHPDKSKNLMSDVITGNNLKYYDSIFDMYLASSIEDQSNKGDFSKDINLAENNYIRFKMDPSKGATSNPTLNLKIAFNKDNTVKLAKAISFTKDMADALFFWLLEYCDDPSQLLSVIGSGTSYKNITLSYNGLLFKFNFNDYLDENSSTLEKYETLKLFIETLFQKIHVVQKSQSIEQNFYLSLYLIEKVLVDTNYLGLSKFGLSMKMLVNGNAVDLEPTSLNNLYYYMTINGDIYVNQILIEKILNLKAETISKITKIKDNLSIYSTSILYSLRYEKFKSISHFLTTVNQIIYACTYVDNVLLIDYVLLSESYFNIYKRSPHGVQFDKLNTFTYSGQNKYEFKYETGANITKDYETYSSLKYRAKYYLDDISIFYTYIKNIVQMELTTVEENSIKKLVDPLFLGMAKNVFTTGTPFAAGKTNYINLSSIKIYTISVSTTVLDKFNEQDSGFSDEFFIDDNTNFKNNPYYRLDDTIYVSGGVSSSLGTLTYIGSAEGKELDSKINYVEGYNNTQSFTKQFYHKVSGNDEYELYEKKDTEYYDDSYGDMSFAENSIILWGGLKTQYTAGNIDTISASDPIAKKFLVDTNKSSQTNALNIKNYTVIG